MTVIQPIPAARFSMGDHVRKKSGGLWRGRVCGFYSTTLTPIGYAVESSYEAGSVQIYSEAALEPWGVCGAALTGEGGE